MSQHLFIYYDKSPQTKDFCVFSLSVRKKSVPLQRF